MTPEDKLRAELENNVRIFPPRGGGQESIGEEQDEHPAPPHEPIETLDWATREGREPPRREFIVEDWAPTGVVISLYAPGGFGKTLLAQLLGSSTAGRPFLGLPTKQVPVLALFCEDDDDELWRRQHRINRALGLRMTDLGDFKAQGRLGMSNLLMVFPKGRPPDPLPLLAEIEAKARAIGARLIILDNAAQLFGGDENVRAEVTAFLNALNGLARRLQAAVLLLGHPPKNREQQYSGSTAWHSVVRCMWTLEEITEKDEDGMAGETAPRLVLTRHKANYAPRGEQIRLRWVDGVLRRDDGEAPMSSVDASFHRHDAKLAFRATLDKLTAQRRNVSHSDRAANYAPKVMKQAGLAEGFTRADLKRAMEELFAEGAIIAHAKLWRGGDRKWVTGIARVAPATRADGAAAGQDQEAPPP